MSDRQFFDLAIDMTPEGSHTVVDDLSEVVTLTNNFPIMKKLMVQAFTQNIRYKIGNQMPTAASGFQLSATTWMIFTVPAGGCIKFIEETASATMQYQWLG